MRISINARLCLLACVFVSPIVSAQDARTSDIDKLIRQLGDDEFSVREDALARLVKIGVPAMAALQKATTSAEPEVRRRALEAIFLMEDRVGRELLTIPSPDREDGRGQLAFSKDGTHAIAIGRAVEWIDLRTGQGAHRVLYRKWGRYSLALSNDGRCLASADGSGEGIDIVDIGKKEVVAVCQSLDDKVAEWYPHKPGIFALVFSPDDGRIASGGAAKSIRLWDAKTGKHLLKIDHGKFGIGSLAYSPDGKFLASGSIGLGYQYRPVFLRDAKTGGVLRSFDAHDRDIGTVVFTPDGKRLLSASLDGWMILWDIATGKELKRMAHNAKDPHSVIMRAAISPDGKRAVTAGGNDRTMRVWNLDTGKEIRRFEGHDGHVLNVAFSPDGRRALSCDSSGTIKLWKLPE